MNSAPSSRGKAARTGPATVAILIPAYEEQDTIGAVAATALASGLGSVIVVDDGSRDATAEVAEAAGAEVMRLTVNRGKGGALWTAANRSDAEVVVLLDADLLGLLPEHVTALAEPVIAGAADMTRGVFKGGRWSTTIAQRVAPQLNGQRALRREALLNVEGLAESRYGVEVAITRHGIDNEWRVVEVPLWDVTQVMKEEKRGWFKGLKVRLRMYAEIVRVLLRADRR